MAKWWAGATCACELYERLGLPHEGRQYGTFQVDGETFDSHAMALLRD